MQIRFLIIFLSILSGVVGCKNTNPITKPPKNVLVKIVHTPEVASYFQSMLEEYAKTNPRLPDGAGIQIQLLEDNALDTAKSLSSGELKVDAWISPSSSLTNYANSMVHNLGGKLSDCKQLFATPIIIAVAPRNLHFFRAQGSTFSWNDLFAARASKGDGDLLATPFTFGHGNVNLSSTGLSALTQLAYLASNKLTTLDLSDLKAQVSADRLKTFESYVSNYTSVENVLLKRTASPQSNRVNFTITTEQRLAIFNAMNRESHSQLVALYPKEGSFWQDYSICTSEADWTGPAHRAGIKSFASFLSTEKSQLEAKQRGFRPSVLPLGDTEPLLKTFGVDTSLPSNSLLPVTGDVVHYLVEQWPQLKRPGALLFLLDSSASMEGAALRVGKEKIRQILAMLPQQDLKALLSFASTAQVNTPFTSDTLNVMKEIDSIKALGGSAVYDGLIKALDTITTQSLLPYRRSIIVYTDGSDKNSIATLDYTIQLFRDTFARHDINITIVGITRDGNSLADLKEIARAANGTIREGSLDDMQSIFAEIIANL